MTTDRWNLALAVGIGMALPTGGCGNPPKPTIHDEPPPVAHTADGDHAHPEEGPHHGHLIELGRDDYHAELVHEESTHTVIIFLLDAAAKERVPIEAKELVANLSSGEKPSQYTLAAAPDAVDPDGKCSRFELRDKALCDSICAPNAKGRVRVEIAGKSYSGAIETLNHKGHDHKPGGNDHK